MTRSLRSITSFVLASCVLLPSAEAVAALQPPKLVKDLAPGAGHGYPGWALVHADTLFFVANDGTTDQVWRSDGTDAGTVRLTAFPKPALHTVIPGELFAAGGRVCFDGPDGIYASDGSTGGTTLIAPGVHRVESNDANPVVTNAGVAYLVARRAGGADTGLWRTDGTAAGTRLVSATARYALGTMGGKIYFTGGGKIWATDGTAAGTAEVAPSANGAPSVVGVLGSELYFLQLDDELWKTDGTAAGTTKVATLPLSGVTVRRDDRAIAHGGKLYFSYEPQADVHETWVTDGSGAGTTKVASSFTESMAQLGGALFFSAEDPTAGNEPAKLTSGAPGVLADLVAGPNGSYPTAFTVWGTRLAFVSRTPSQQMLQISDGTTTTALGGALSLANVYSASILGATSRTLFLRGNDATHGVELWAAVDDSVPLPKPPAPGSDAGAPGKPDAAAPAPDDPPSAEEPAVDGPAQASPAASEDGGGCTTTRTAPPAGATAFALVASALVLARRRRAAR